MYDPIIILLDVIVFLLAFVAFIISVLKIRVVTRGVLSWGWWYLLPFIFAWTTMVRFLYVLVAIDVIDRVYSPWITASQVVFYVGVVMFLWDFYTTTRDLIPENKY